LKFALIPKKKKKKDWAKWEDTPLGRLAWTLEAGERSGAQYAKDTEPLSTPPMALFTGLLLFYGPQVKSLKCESETNQPCRLF